MKTRPQTHKWQFQSRFRRHAFGWKSRPAIQRVQKAVTEIKSASRKDSVIGAEGAVRFLERLSPALEHVDGSSGSIGAAVNKAIRDLVPIVAGATVDDDVRERWLERLWAAHEADEMPYIEILGDYWGELCASKRVASAWADRLKEVTELALSPDPEHHGHFHGTMACFSSLLAAGRYDEILSLVAGARFKWWHYRQWGVRALAAMGRVKEAIEYAERRERNDSPYAIARLCEEILLSAGLKEQAYALYGLEASRRASHLATFRSVREKYPERTPAQILLDLVENTPGEEGKWFAAAKDAGLYDEAIDLANRTPCDPRTLARAARDFGQTNPRFAIEAGVASLRWLAEGYGYDITGLDISSAWTWTLKAAENAGRSDEVRERVRKMVSRPERSAEFVRKVIGLDLSIER